MILITSGQKNPEENVLDPPHHACYTKTGGKRFLITQSVRDIDIEGAIVSGIATWPTLHRVKTLDFMHTFVETEDK
jgi:hypothetical protein